MREVDRCQFELVETVGEKFRYRCSRCGFLTAPTSHTPDRVFKECSRAIKDGYWLNLECIHRGEEVRKIECEVCGKRGREESVYYCAIYGECTERRAVYRPTPKVCLGCPSHVHPS